MKEYVSLMIAGIFSICAEWWSWEIITLLCGLLGPIQLATHVVFAAIIPLYFMIPLGVGLAGASVIGKLIGQNRFDLARKMGNAILWFTLAESVLIGILSFIFRDKVPLLFTDNDEVIDIAKRLSPWFAVFVIWDAFQGSFQGILRGIKRQGKSVIGVIAGPWLITIPLACLLAFNPVIDLKIFGMWIGNNAGYCVMVCVFWYLWLTFDWNEMSGNVVDDKVEEKEDLEGMVVKDNVLTSISISHFSAFLSVSQC